MSLMCDLFFIVFYGASSINKTIVQNKLDIILGIKYESLLKVYEINN